MLPQHKWDSNVQTKKGFDMHMSYNFILGKYIILSLGFFFRVWILLDRILTILSRNQLVLGLVKHNKPSFVWLIPRFKNAIVGPQQTVLTTIDLGYAISSAWNDKAVPETNWNRSGKFLASTPWNQIKTHVEVDGMK